MIAKNPARVDFYQRYLDIVAEYNRDKDDAEIQRVFEELFAFMTRSIRRTTLWCKKGLKTKTSLPCSIYE